MHRFGNDACRPAGNILFWSAHTFHMTANFPTQVNGEERYFEEKKKNPHELPFPNLPYYKDGDIRLTQSMAILRHLARKYNMGSSTEEEARQLDMLEGVVS